MGVGIHFTMAHFQRQCISKESAEGAGSGLSKFWIAREGQGYGLMFGVKDMVEVGGGGEWKGEHEERWESVRRECRERGSV